jgi:hypothetical protein
MRGDRFCYQNVDKGWRSMTHHVFVDDNGHPEVYWVITDFAGDNPNAYNWMSFSSEIEKRRARSPGGISNIAVLEDLLAAGTILDYWPESTPNSPFVQGRGMDCPNPDLISDSQCQGACYFLGYATAILYTANSHVSSQECHCARSCTLAANGPPVEYYMWKWFEGFYFDSNTNTVNILAVTDRDDLTVNMWIQVSDNCGNSAVGLVEFWVAPSLEAAAAQGRTCVEPNHNPGQYVTPFAFSSDDLITPQPPSNPSAAEDTCNSLAAEFLLTYEWAITYGHLDVVPMDDIDFCYCSGKGYIVRQDSPWWAMWDGFLDVANMHWRDVWLGPHTDASSSLDGSGSDRGVWRAAFDEHCSSTVIVDPATDPSSIFNMWSQGGQGLPSNF